MKHLFLSLATTTTLLLLILLSTTANGDDDKIVYDVMGEPLIADEKYYIIPNNIAREGGGFTWNSNDYSARCRDYYVSQYHDNTNSGKPTAFYPLNSRKSEITLSTDLNIAFKASPPSNPSYCHARSNVWKVEKNEVVLDGQMGVRDPSSIFTIEDLKEGGYGIRFCPRYGRYDCGGLGFIKERGEFHLVVNGTSPLAVVFEPEPIFLKKYGIA